MNDPLSQDPTIILNGGVSCAGMVVLFENAGPASTQSNHTKNNQVKLIGSIEALKHIDHVVMTVCWRELRYDCLVDVADYAYLKDYIWRTDSMGYAVAQPPSGKIYMHRLICERNGLGVKGKEIDHVNRCRMDNRFKNLRVCDKINNTRNMTKRSNTSSRYKGVCRDIRRNKWRLTFVCSSPPINYQKRFDTEIEAALSYNELALKYHGDFASLNVIDYGTNN